MPFEGLLKKLSFKIKGIVFRLNSREASFDNDDLYQEAVAHLWRAHTAGTLADKTDSYILQGCYFYLKNYLRTHRTNARLVSLDAPRNNDNDEHCPEEIGALASNEPLREEAHCRLLIERIRNNGLTAREKDVFLLSLEGLTMREIGARLGISHVRAVKLSKAMRVKCRAHMDC
jgi:RNA polymerase sigma factor (sigma-70 family)